MPAINIMMTYLQCQYALCIQNRTDMGTVAAHEAAEQEVALIPEEEVEDRYNGLIEETHILEYDVDYNDVIYVENPDL